MTLGAWHSLWFHSDTIIVGSRLTASVAVHTMPAPYNRDVAASAATRIRWDIGILAEEASPCGGEHPGQAAVSGRPERQDRPARGLQAGRRPRLERLGRRHAGALVHARRPPARDGRRGGQA